MIALRRCFALIFLLGWMSTARAQVTISPQDTAICPNTPLTLNATIGSSSGNFVIFTDDIYSSVINLGFSFTFYGNTYTQCVLSSNGLISFNLSNAGLSSGYQIPGPGPVPGNTNTLNSIMGPFHDIDPSVRGSIEYSTQGVAPNRRFVVTFCNVAMFSCNSLLASHQIVLFEGSNIAEVHIATKPTCASWNGGGAIEGVQNSAGTAAVVVPGRNWPTQWTATNDGQRFTPSGNTYTVSSIPFQFYPTGLNNITWYEGTSTTAIGTGSSITVNPTGNTFYRAIAQGCVGTSSDTVNVTIGTPSAPPTVVTPLTYCVGVTPPALTATGTNLMWYTTPTGGTGTPTLVPSTAVAGTTTYYVSQNVNGCESAREPLVVNVLNNPIVSVTASSTTVCPGAFSLLTASGAGTYSWSPSTGLSGTVGPTVLASPTATTTYSVIGGVSVGANTVCYDTADITITLTPNPPIVATSNSPVCAGETITFTATAPAGAIYNWTGPSTFVSNQQNPTIPNATAVVQGTYTVTATVNGCDSEATVEVTVLPTFLTTTTVSICAGQTYTFNGVTYATSGTYADTFSTVNGCDSIKVLQLTVQPPVTAPVVTSPIERCQGTDPIALTATGQNLLWYVVPTGGGASSVPPAPPTTTPGNYTYYVSQTINGCEGARAAIIVQVPYTPQPPVVTVPAPYCKGEIAAPLSATGINILWYTGASSIVGSPNAPTPSTAVPGTFNYYATQTDGSCESPRAPVPVIVKPLPPARILLDTLPVCAGDTAFFTAFDPGPGAVYTWNFPPQALVQSGTDAGPYAVTWTGSGNFPVGLTVLQNGCVDSTILAVPVTGPQASDFLMDTLTCAGTEVEINAGDIPGFLPGFGFQWNFDGGTVTSGAQGGPYTVKWSQSGIRYVTLQLTANGCPGAITTHSIQVSPLPEARIARPVDNDVCGGDTMTLRVENPSILNKYSWGPKRFFDEVSEGSLVRGRIYASDYVSVIATSPHGCKAGDSVEIKTRPCCELMIPTAFSPNNDGRNDRFRAISDGFHHDYELRIVNRYGQVMFLGKSQLEGWDGTRNGIPQDPGVYFYHIRYDCVDGSTREKSGDVMLVR